MKYLPLLLLLTSCSFYNEKTLKEGECYSDGYYSSFKIIKKHKYGISALQKNTVNEPPIKRNYYSYDNDFTSWKQIDCEVVEEFK